LIKSIAYGSRRDRHSRRQCDRRYSLRDQRTFRATLVCALRRSFEKRYIEKCAHYSDSSMQFTLGAVYRANCDFVSSWARYNISHHLGSKDAIERLTSLEELLTKKETERALEQSQKIEANLKPTLCNIALQGPET
jgi:hypothetical protein